MVLRAVLALGAVLVLLPHEPDTGLLPDGPQTAVGSYITQAEVMLKSRFVQALKNLHQQKADASRARAAEPPV